MYKLGDILKKFNPVKDKYVSREFQSFGIYLAETLGDHKHTALYIKLAKTVPRPILEKALSFVKDANARNRAKLFMWKMKELKDGKAVQDMKQVHLIISGRVQGVGYRSWAVRTALEAGLTGWVANRPDGTVEVVAEGEGELLEEFIHLCRNGPDTAHVKDINVVWKKATKRFATFMVKM